MKIGYFPGCSLQSTEREYDESVRAVAAALEIELEEVNDWGCCGASSAHATNRLLSIALPARTLALAAAQKMERVFAPCAACYNRLATARHVLATEPELAERVHAVLGTAVDTAVGVVSAAQMFSELASQIREQTTVPLKDLKLACYYGCLLVRPPAVCQFDDAESPTSLETVVSATGATPVRWKMALECCGGGFSLSRTSSVVRLGRAILQDARAAGAQAVVVACPMCHTNLDFRQRAMAERAQPGQEPLPVIFVSQLVGLALGLKPEALGLRRHFVDPQPLLARVATAKSLPEHGGPA
ncbi:MAG: CoB--CoM heterodisulfide reductase iron-sulfur subunit B family protein [Deltaproteobacteria bacterium]|nr:CoB--CoM heterodisulfide reductase iron-sulfur subunit B family protein [Deltaproteobacteria bacterium]